MNATAALAAEPRRRTPHAIVMMLAIIVAAVVLTHVVPKDFSGTLRPASTRATGTARPSSPVAIVSSIPAGMTRTASLIFMILFIGGMFGVLQETGALEAGIERLLVATNENAAVVVPVLMVLLAAGSSFLGLISEYLVVIPMALVLAERLGYDALFGTALVAIAAKIGYLTSVTNPLALAVAQPLVGVPVFSGAAFRAVTFVLLLPVGIWYLFHRFGLRRRDRSARPAGEAGDAARATPRLTVRHRVILVALFGAIVAMVVGVQRWEWGSPELGAMYIALAIMIAVLAGLGSREASQAFVRGMQGMMLAALLVGLAASVELILRDGMILDSIVNALASSVNGKPPVIVANLMMVIQMAIDVFIPSTSGKAAITMPILGPIGQLAGVSGQVTVQAFLFGNGLMNTVTPTSGMLLAYLATGKVSFGRWIRFILPLALILFVLCALMLTIAVLVER